MRPPDIFGIPTSIFFLKPELLWLSFIIFSVGVVLSAKFLIDKVDYFYLKNSSYVVILTFLLLPIITTIPIIISTVAQSAFNDATIGINGVIGSNIFLIIIASSNVFVLFLTLKVKNKKKSKKVRKKTHLPVDFQGHHILKENFLSYISIIAVVIFLILGLTIDSATIDLGNTSFSIFSFLTFLTYVMTVTIFIILGYKSNQKKKETLKKKKSNENDAFILKQLNDEQVSKQSKSENLKIATPISRSREFWKHSAVWIWIAIICILLSGFGYMQSAVVNAMTLPISQGGYDISDVSAGGLLLGISGALPEISSTYFLFKKNRQKIALQALFLDNLFTFSLIFLADIITGPGNALTHIHLIQSEFIPTLLLLVLVALNLSVFYSQFLFKLNFRNSIIFTSANYAIFFGLWISSATISQALGN